MSVNTVDLHVSQLKEDLANGLTWLTEEDAGFGSIQSKYDATTIQILTIKKHPKLVGLQPCLTIFRIIDDETNANSTADTGQVQGSLDKGTGTDISGDSRQDTTGGSNEETNSISSQASWTDGNDRETVVRMEDSNTNMGASLTQRSLLDEIKERAAERIEL